MIENILKIWMVFALITFFSVPFLWAEHYEIIMFVALIPVIVAVPLVCGMVFLNIFYWLIIARFKPELKNDRDRYIRTMGGITNDQ